MINSNYTLKHNATIILTLFLALSLCGCRQHKEKDLAAMAVEPAVSQQKETKAANVSPLTTEQFKQRVMNYDEHPNEWVFEGDKPAIVDFYATWCGPCRQTAPILEELAGKYAGKIDIYKVDVDEETELAQTFGIQSIPTLLFIPKNGMPQSAVGAMQKHELEQAIDSLLAQ